MMECVPSISLCVFPGHSPTKNVFLVQNEKAEGWYRESCGWPINLAFRTNGYRFRQGQRPGHIPVPSVFVDSRGL